MKKSHHSEKIEIPESGPGVVEQGRGAGLDKLVLGKAAGLSDMMQDLEAGQDDIEDGGAGLITVVEDEGAGLIAMVKGEGVGLDDVVENEGATPTPTDQTAPGGRSASTRRATPRRRPRGWDGGEDRARAGERGRGCQDVITATSTVNVCT